MEYKIKGSYKSIAVFGKPKEVIEYQPLDLHINLWSIKTEKKSPFYALDLGIMFSLDVEELLLLMPFKVKKKESIIDLGGRLGTNKNLLCSVFNEYYGISQMASSNVVKIIDADDKSIFGIYKLTYGSSIKMMSNGIDGNYTELSICPQYDCKNLKEKGINKIYVRFQIKLENLEPFATNTDISNDILQNAFSSCHLFDFRINDLREIAYSITEKLKKDEYIKAKFTCWRN